MDLHIQLVEEVTHDLVRAFGRLLPQLSSSAVAPDAETLARVVAFPGNRLLVARSGGEVVGTLTLVLLPLPTGVRARIEDVVVDRAARGRGIGAALCGEALRLAAEAGARSVDLTSRPGREAADRLYRRLGFRPRDTRTYRHADPGGAVNPC
jgi:ribosomal protein S18 acetylase RimI-like enzyme